ncbi:MAG TPA: RdgB/HAM1 family non-canonical purine NTP pyrophosphatase [Povalibacter sp.]|nr:RdgB/HAM1 family non-canonical purine NTP pyrophosphatase [Povalibacter sp.]
MRLVLATQNPGKLKELQALLTPLAIEVLAQSQFTDVAAEETGLSFVENAILKARHAARAAGLPAIADDSGIEVDALHGAPGIYSARYAGPGANDRANLEKLVRELRDVPAAKRTARYRCALAFMRWDLDPSPLVCQACWEGHIIDTPRGDGGFGYDPVFELADGRTVAELPALEKNRLSHRGQALRLLVEQLPLVRGSAASGSHGITGISPTGL